MRLLWILSAPLCLENTCGYSKGLNYESLVFFWLTVDENLNFERQMLHLDRLTSFECQHWHVLFFTSTYN